VDEILGMLVDRMDSDEGGMYVNISMCFEDLLETGKHDHAFANCMPVPNKEEMASLKAGWKKFSSEPWASYP